MSGAYAYAFEGEIVPHDVGKYRYRVIFLPEEIAEALDFPPGGRLRFEGEVEDHPLAAAWQPSAGRWYVMLGKPLLKALDMDVGDMAYLRFTPLPDDQPEIPFDLASALEDPDLWARLTPGKQRALVHHLESAKTEATRSKRLAQILDWLPEGKDLRQLGKM